MRGIFHFRFRIIFIKVYVFVQKSMENKKIKIEKPHTVLLPELWFLSHNKKLKIQWYLHEVELPKNWRRYKLFKLRKSKFRVGHFFSIVTFNNYLTFLYLAIYCFEMIYLFRDSEFSSYEIELQNGVLQNDVTLWVINSKIFIEILLSSY